MAILSLTSISDLDEEKRKRYINISMLSKMIFKFRRQLLQGIELNIGLEHST